MRFGELKTVFPKCFGELYIQNFRLRARSSVRTSDVDSENRAKLTTANHLDHVAINFSKTILENCLWRVEIV